MTLAVFLQVVMRYVFTAPLSWPEELVGLLLIWLACFGAAHLVREKEHIAFHFIKDRFPASLQSKVTFLVHLFVMIFFIIGLVQGVLYAFSEIDQVTDALQIPVCWVYFGVSFSFACMMLFELELLMRDLSQRS